MVLSGQIMDQVNQQITAFMTAKPCDKCGYRKCKCNGTQRVKVTSLPRVKKRVKVKVKYVISAKQKSADVLGIKMISRTKSKSVKSAKHKKCRCERGAGEERGKD